MDKTELTGIERELVLQYLIDGNVPVTVTLFDGGRQDGEQPLPAVFPVALKAEQIVVLEKGVILLKNPPEAVQGFAGKRVKVEFYFNRLGLYFVTDMMQENGGLALAVPDAIQRIQDSGPDAADYNFTARFYYSCRNKVDINIECVPADGYTLFSRPVWSSIPVEIQHEAKRLLEQFVSEAKREKNVGNGIQLIPVCRYLAEKDRRAFESLEGRVKPLGILFVNHERIVVSGDVQNFQLCPGSEYAVKMSFRLGEGPVATRDVFATCAVGRTYASASGRVCADCAFTSVQEEDVRFLYEKATRNLFL